MRRLVALASVISACGAQGAHGRSGPGDTSPRANGEHTKSAVEAGVTSSVRACLHESTDFAPCSEECDRGIGASCARLASAIERGQKKASAPKDPDAGGPRTLPSFDAIDMTRVASLYTRACELHDAPSCLTAAGMYAHGIGVARSRGREIELLVSACNLDVASACSTAARAFERGAGVAKDEARAKELHRRACAGGIEESCEGATPP